MNAPLAADRKSCPHGHVLRRKCSLCDYADMAEDCQELIAERDALTQKVCELITQRQQAQHERDCAVEKIAAARPIVAAHITLIRFVLALKEAASTAPDVRLGAEIELKQAEQWLTQSAVTRT